MRRALSRAPGVAGALLVVTGAALWVLPWVLPIGRDPDTRVLLSPTTRWPVTATGPRLAGDALAVGGLALLLGTGCWLRARRPLPGTGRAVVAAGAGTGLVLAGLLVLLLAAPPPGDLVYLSPEQYDRLVAADRLERAGQLLLALGLPALGAGLGGAAGRRSTARGVLTSGDG